MQTGAQWACGQTAATLGEAADRIECLEVALRELLADTPHANHNCGDPDCPVDRARAVLGGMR